jgi:formamidopyrimidine-DNA glycosylase
VPELAELRLTADYINGVTSGVTFDDVQKNPEHKGVEVDLHSDQFRISAESRGKELMIHIDHLSEPGEKLLMTMGMSGHFQWADVGMPLPKHTHLAFTSDRGVLCFVDVRRFGKWKLAGNWSANRGPDPVAEHCQFIEVVKQAAAGRNGDKPIHLALMDQSLFNGIGNYLRSELIYRLDDLSPFATLREAIKKPQFFQLCHDIPLIAYKLGGGQLKDWKSPTGEDPQSFRDFIKCYGKMASFKDKSGRTFWMDSKWIR